MLHPQLTLFYLFIIFDISFKVHIFLESHNILQILHCRFDSYYIKQIEISQKFVPFSEYTNFIKIDIPKIIFVDN